MLLGKRKTFLGGRVARSVLVVFAAGVLGGCSCGTVAEDFDAGGADAATTLDGGTTDAAPMAVAPDVSEVVSGAGRLSGGAYQTDVQLGHWFSQAPFSGANTTGQGAAAIKP